MRPQLTIAYKDKRGNLEPEILYFGDDRAEARAVQMKATGYPLVLSGSFVPHKRRVNPCADADSKKETKRKREK